MVRAALFCAALTLTAAVAAADDWLQQVNFDRPGGAYVSLPAPDARGCAAQCARDGLCLAWSFQPGAAGGCALKAVVTPARPAPGFVSGLAARAPRFAALTGSDVSVTPDTSLHKPALPAKTAAKARTYDLLGAPEDAL